MTDFASALLKVLVHEGSWSNHSKDPGGATMKGVTQRVYDEWRRGRGMKAASVRYISQSELEAIYRERYWNLFRGDDMPDGVNYVVFDGAVNSGVGQSVKWLQRALAPAYKGTVDGIAGPGTIQAIATFNNNAALIDRICDQRMAFLKSLKTWGTFGKGWARRVSDVRALGKAWARNEPPMAFAAVTSPTPDDEQAKALPSDIASAPPVAPGDAAAYGGGATATISQALGQLQALQGIPSVQQVILWLTVAGVVIAAAGFVYRFWAARRKAEIKKVSA